jgi:ABC-type transporter Mla MlaB component
VQEAAEVIEVAEPESDTPVVTIDDDAIESATEEIEIDITVDKDGDIEIVVEANQDAEIAIEIAVETPQIDGDVMDEIVEEVMEMPTEELETEVSESEPEAIVEPLIELNSEATIKHIAALYETIKRTLEVHDTIEINASDVTTIDTATLQLLVSLKKDTSQSNKTVDIIYPSTRFIESAKLLNLLDVLEVTEI